MAKGKIVQELRTWRLSRGLTMDEAGALIVIDGKPTHRAMWHSWERGKKVPSDTFMFELERVTGVAPNAYYDRPRACDRVQVAESNKNQPAMI